MHLQELKLAHCKMPKKVLSQLLDQLIDCSSLSSLCLSKANFSSESIAKLCHFVYISPTLRSLDLSWNELSYKDYRPILRCLADNSTLEDINLSHN